MADDSTVATVDGSLQQPGGGGPPSQGAGNTGTGTTGTGTIHSSDTLTLDTPPTAPPSDSSHHQYRQSGSHLSYVSDKTDLRTPDKDLRTPDKEKEALEERVERSASGLSGGVPQGMVLVPYDPDCGCMAPFPPYPVNAK